MKPIISPSILSADFGYLARDLEMINRSEAEWVHIDIMDGVFVPNISFGFPVLKYVAKLTDKPLDAQIRLRPLLPFHRNQNGDTTHLMCRHHHLNMRTWIA